MFVFMGTPSGPCLWEIDKSTFEVTPRGKLFPNNYPSELTNSTAEGWYFSTFDPYRIYCPTDDYLRYYNIITKDLKMVVHVENFSYAYGVEGSTYALRQWHSSYDETVHSATALQRVEDGAWPKIGSFVCRSIPSWEHRYFPAQGVLDECQIDKSGRWLVVKENDDHRIIDLATDVQTPVTDADGALGHSDNGFGYAIGADNWQDLAAWRLHNFIDGTSQIIYETPWDEQILHVSHCNAELSPAANQWVLGSGTDPYLKKIYLDGSFVDSLVAPSMCVGSDYDNLPKASLDPYGEFAFWIRGGARFDAFLVRVP
jgi:hypothetical protein